MVLTNRQVYERAASDEENLLIDTAIELVWKVKKPPGWIKRENRGRPKKRGRGRPEEFHWQAATVVLILMNYLGLDHRGMAAHLNARPELLRKLNLKKAPRKSNVHRAHQRMSEAWLKDLNDKVVAQFKKGVDRQRSTWRMTAPVWRREGEASTTSSASTRRSGRGSSANFTSPRSAGSLTSRSTPGSSHPP